MLRVEYFSRSTPEITPRTLGVDAYLEYLIEEHTLYGVSFQNWVPLVGTIFLIWIGVLASIRS